MSLWLFCWWLWTVFVQCGKSVVSLYSIVLVCLSFSWGRYYSVSVLNIVDSPILVFIRIVPCQFEQVLPNLSSFDQTNPKNQGNIHKHLFESFMFKSFISKPACVLVLFICANKNKQHIYTYRRHHLPGHHSRGKVPSLR